MVDFQSRDTRRGQTDEEAEDDTEADDSATDSEPAEAATEVEETAEYGPETTPFAIVTVSGGTIDEDVTGDAVAEAIEHEGNAVATRELLPREYDGVQSTVDTLAGRADVDAIVTVGGVGVGPDDVTVDALDPLFDKRLPGFGELYRVLSHDFDGTAVVRTRTTAGIVDGVPTFCLPGDTAGARRAVEQIVLEEVEALVEETTHDDSGE